MANCGGRAMFSLNYDHSEMRTPMSLMADPHHLGSAKPPLSIDAVEFVPSFKPTQMASNVGPNLNHHAYQQQPQQFIHLQQHPHQPFQTPQQPQQLLSHPQHPQQHQPFHLAQPILNASFQQPMHNSYPNQRRGGNGGGRHNSVQDRLNPHADPQHMLHQNHHHNQHHQGQSHHQQQQNHSHHHQQNHHNIQQHHLPHNNQGSNHQSIGKHQMHHVHKLEQQQHHQQHQQQHHQNQHSNNMRRNNGGSNAQHQQQQSVAVSDPNEDALPTEAEGAALNFLVEVIAKLNEDPGMFENCQKELNAIYIEFSQNTYVISNAIEIIFDQSICEQNFRYMGAKICRLLDAIDASPNSQFRSLLRMKMAFSQEENRQFMTNEAHKVRGTTLFLAELFLQLQNDGSRIADIAHNILQTIDLLLHKTTPENIKCVCFALKLCGYDLELDCHNEVGGILNALKQLNEVDVSTERLIKSVLDLAANRWGRNETTSLNTPVIEQSQQVFTNDPVFYGPDGKIITEEESSFLSSILAAANEQCEDSEKDELDSDPEMDDEMQVAYKDFLQAMPK